MCPSGRSSAQMKSAHTKPLFRPAFDVLDTDGDGKISREDLLAFYTDEDLVGSMISSADFNRNGVVEYDEFEQILNGGARCGEGVMEDVFRAMDADGDGRVSYSDLKTYLTAAGLKVSDEEIKAMILLGGGGGGGGGEDYGVSFEGLLTILAIN